ncbi:MAG: hypothetical protein M0R03_18645 [Novosphingobium sp.]|jgi:hypothetical protein|nr:hypothetical protein [Novosphingobium sp.]
MTEPVYAWLLDGEPVNFGTRAEFDSRNAQGDGLTLGPVIGAEPTAEEKRRREVWAAINAEDERTREAFASTPPHWLLDLAKRPPQ